MHIIYISTFLTVMLPSFGHRLDLKTGKWIKVRLGVVFSVIAYCTFWMSFNTLRYKFSQYATYFFIRSSHFPVIYQCH